MGINKGETIAQQMTIPTNKRFQGFMYFWASA